MSKKNILTREIVDLILNEDIVKLNEAIINDQRILSKLNKDGQNILIISIVYEKFEVSNFILDNFKFDLNVKDKIGWSALHYSVVKRNISIINKLFEGKADLEIKDNYGNTPLARATFESRGFGGIIELLLKQGANPDNKNIKGISPLELAKTIANYNIIQFF